MHSIRDENGVYELTRQTIAQSEARVASLKREIALLEEIIAQNRSFLERIERASSGATPGNAPLAERMGGSTKALGRRARDARAGDRRLRGTQTYAASILDVLAESAHGMTTAELTEHFRSIGHPISKRHDAAKAVSNQLSALKGKNLVVRDRQKRFTVAGARPI